LVADGVGAGDRHPQRAGRPVAGRLDAPRAPITPGTPAFYWAAAKETYATGDYQKTVEHLGNILSSPNDYVARAQPMLVLTSGMAQGYIDLAEAFDAGARANHTQTASFHRQVNTYRGAANTLALQFADNFSKFQSKDEFITLAFAYPTGSPAAVVLLNKAAGGVWLPEAEIDTAQKRAIEHAVLLATCRAAGATNDPAKTQELLKTGEAKIPRATFVEAMAAALFDESQLYAYNKLDQPDKMKIFCSRAQEALKTAPASNESQDPDKKIQAALRRRRQPDTNQVTALRQHLVTHLARHIRAIAILIQHEDARAAAAQCLHEVGGAE
jgi:hypothetical protein